MTREQDLDVVQNAISEYRGIATSHAVEPTRKAQMLSIISTLEALARGAVSQPLQSYETRVRPVIHDRLNDLMSLSPVPARPGKVVILNRDDIRRRADYWILACNRTNKYRLAREDGSDEREAEGGYVFTILVSRPWEVRIGTRMAGGHTAISRGADVYFAGEINFVNGDLDFWNNDSGHYRPDSNLSPQVKHLLPFVKYRNRPI